MEKELILVSAMAKKLQQKAERLLSYRSEIKIKERKERAKTLKSALAINIFFFKLT